MSGALVALYHGGPENILGGVRRLGPARVQGGNIAVCHIHRHRAAAASVHLAQLGNLPEHPGFVQDPADVSNRFRVRVGGPGFAPCAGVLAEADAVVHLSLVALFEHIREIGVIGRGHVCAETEGLLKAGPQGNVFRGAEVLDEGIKSGGLHTRYAVGPNLLFVSQDADGGLFRGFRQVQQGFQGGVGTDPVVMAIRADQGPVQADVTGLQRRNRLQLRGIQVVLYNAVLLIQQIHNGQLHPAALVLAADGSAAKEDVQRLAGNRFRQGLLVLGRAEMGQQVRNHQPGVSFVLADAYRYLTAVLHRHHTVQRQGEGQPLIFPDAAIIMGLKVRKLAVLVEGIGLQIQPGGIDMGGGKLNALRKRLRADMSQHHSLAPVAEPDLAAGLQRHAPGIGPVTRFLRQPDGLRSTKTLRLARVQKCLVARAVALHGLQVNGFVIAVLLAGQQFFL